LDGRSGSDRFLIVYVGVIILLVDKEFIINIGFGRPFYEELLGNMNVGSSCGRLGLLGARF